MTLTLRCDASQATLLPTRGGLLSELSLTDPKGNGQPVLWHPETFRGEASGWPGGGLPLLFPFAGRVFHQGQPFQIELAGKLRQMPLHGFAYAVPWTVIDSGPSTATLELRTSTFTEDLYPFPFVVTARYELTKHELAVEMRVQQEPSGTAPMPVALGFHPYFRMPLTRGAPKSSCDLITSAKTKVRVTPLGGAGKAAPFPESSDEQNASLSDPLLANLILADHDQPKAWVVDQNSGLAIEVAWSEPLRYLVLWTQPGQGFHCVEPWMGLPDAVSNGQGCQWLTPGQSLTAAMSIRLTQRR